MREATKIGELREAVHQILDNEHPMTLGELQCYLVSDWDIFATRTEVRIACDSLVQCGSWLEGGAEVFTTDAESIAAGRQVLGKLLRTFHEA